MTNSAELVIVDHLGEMARFFFRMLVNFKILKWKFLKHGTNIVGKHCVRVNPLRKSIFFVLIFINLF